MKEQVKKRILMDGLIVALLIASICAAAMAYVDRLHLDHLQEAERLIHTYDETFHHVVYREPNMAVAM